MFEELLSKDEVHEEQVYPMIYRGKTPEVNINIIYKLTEQVNSLSTEELRGKLLDTANFRVAKLKILV